MMPAEDPLSGPGRVKGTAMYSGIESSRPSRAKVAWSAAPYLIGVGKPET
jgi:hypothetical protein